MAKPISMSIYKMAASKRIALVAHDNKKKELIEWAVYNKTVLSMHRLFATGTTGKMLEKAIGMTITKFMSGPLGGDQQIGARIAERKIAGTRCRARLWICEPLVFALYVDGVLAHRRTQPWR